MLVADRVLQANHENLCRVSEPEHLSLRALVPITAFFLFFVHESLHSLGQCFRKISDVGPGLRLTELGLGQELK